MGDFRRRLGIILIGLCCLLTSCSPFSSKKAPIVLILLESFSEQDFLCSDPRRLEGLVELEAVCDEFIRFTHVYAPSTLSQPSLASLVTGKEASEHGVVHNGSQAISARFHTLAEAALNLKMRTSFFSGGAPLLKKFGISQGYEEFDDVFQSKEKQFFRPLQTTVDKALSWIDTEVHERSFFVTLYGPDLLYRNIRTTDNLGSERPINRNSSVQEVYESINALIKGLKDRKKWSNTNLIILGISGQKKSLKPLNPLSGVNLHVPLQIKLAQSIDSNLKELTTEMISFARLGTWIEKLIFHKPSQGGLLFSPDREDRLISQRSSWRQWMGLANWSVAGLRKRQYLFTYNPVLKVYDTFFDKKEFEPLPDLESAKLARKFDITKKAKSFFMEDCFLASMSSQCPPKKTEVKIINDLSLLMSWSEIVWNSEKPTDNMSQLVVQARVRRSRVVINWLAYHALYQKKWTNLFELGQYINNKAWMLVAQANLRETPSFELSDCLKYFIGERNKVEDFYKYCQDSDLRRVVEGVGLLKSKKRPSDSFWAEVGKIKNIRRAKNINLKMHFINDIAEPFNFEPRLSELYFFLPEHTSYQKLINVDES